jgi:hypothetical protein
MSKYRADPCHGHTEVWLLLAKYRRFNESIGK